MIPGFIIFFVEDFATFIFLINSTIKIYKISDTEEFAYLR
jgi:hypothetical protein